MPNPSQPIQVQDAVSVGQITRDIRAVLEGTFPHVRVFGEVVGLARPRSGHIYLTLKDCTGEDDAQISVVIWRDRAQALRFPLEDGMLVVVQGHVALYPPRGAYQIIAASVQPAGQGTWLVAFERLKEKLLREGLFEAERKRPLPFMPREIGIITSPTGAALHDVLRSLFRRFPAAVRVFPSRVQGEGSADEIVAALDAVDAYQGPLDLVILARGGGSLEDLWTFNEERVVRRVAECTRPTIAAVGHEVDVTLVDLVADVRAQTPTEGGEIAVPDYRQLVAAAVEDGTRLCRAFERCHRDAWNRSVQWRQRLLQASPESRLRHASERLQMLGSALQKSLYNRFREWDDLLAISGEKLEALSPFSVLKRGFSVVRHPESGEELPSGAARGPRIVRSATEVEVGDELQILLGAGKLDVRVLRRETQANDGVKASR